jgi:hypothetical protein
LSAFIPGNHLCKPGEGAVKGLFHFRWENAAGELAIFKMIGNALAALALSGTRLIGTGASGLIGFNVTFHLSFALP